MDGDLQHPPEVVPELLGATRDDSVDAVVASRYRGSGDTAGLAGWLRRLVSRASGTLARLAFPRRLQAVTDPMSGFFAVRRSAVDCAALRPDGYKIMLEILLRNRLERIEEVSYRFQPRSAGRSKASVREGLRFLRHLTRLRLGTSGPHAGRPRFLLFAAAGASGVVVNSALLAALTGVAALPYLIASFMATQATIAWNFLLVDSLAMPRAKHPLGRRFGRFWLLNSSAIPLHLALLAGLVQVMRVPLLPANVVAILAVFLLRYVLTSRWVYGVGRGSPVLRPATVRAVVGRVRRAALARVLIAVTLTAIAFPAATSATWNSLWVYGEMTAPVVPLLVAMVIMVARIRPAPGEPDVHDRQLDLLIAGFLLALTGGLVVLAPAERLSIPLLIAATSFLCAGVVLLLGTRTAARLRWALVLPAVAIAAATPRGLVDVLTWVMQAGVNVVSGPFAASTGSGGLAVRHDGQTLAVPVEATSGLALGVALACLVLAGLSTMPVRYLLARLSVAATGVTAAAIGVIVLAMAAGRLLGPDAMRALLTPVVPQAAVAGVAVTTAWRWARTTTPSRASVDHLPRGRVAAPAFAGFAVLFALVSPPLVPWTVPEPLRLDGAWVTPEMRR
jgi:putative flippase GtrA